MSVGLATSEAAAVELWNDDRTHDAVPVVGHGGERGLECDGMFAEWWTCHCLYNQFESGTVDLFAAGFDRAPWAPEGRAQ